MKTKPVVVLLALLGLFVAWSYTPGSLQRQDINVTLQAPASPATLQPEIDDVLAQSSENPSIRWFHRKPDTQLKGAALVIHGLNMRPAKMQPIIANLTEAGIDVLALSLRGHGDNYRQRPDIDSDKARLETFKTVSYPLWLNEAYSAYLQVKKRAVQKEVPVFLTAFSFGCLIGLDLLTSHSDVHFDRMVLLAPALKLHAFYYLERVLAPFPQLVLPSFAPDSYLANKKGTPVAAYNALFEGLERFEKNAGSKINIPALILIDEQDEFIPLWSLEKFAKEKKLDQWKFYIVHKDQSTTHERFHHHIIDEASTGKTVWQEMMAAAIAHLKN